MASIERLSTPPTEQDKQSDDDWPFGTKRYPRVGQVDATTLPFDWLFNPEGSGRSPVPSEEAWFWRPKRLQPTPGERHDTRTEPFDWFWNPQGEGRPPVPQDEAWFWRPKRLRPEVRPTPAAPIDLAGEAEAAGAAASPDQPAGPSSRPAPEARPAPTVYQPARFVPPPAEGLGDRLRSAATRAWSTLQGAAGSVGRLVVRRS